MIEKEHVNDTYWPRHSSLSVNHEALAAYEQQPSSLQALRERLAETKKVKVVDKVLHPVNQKLLWVIATDTHSEPLIIPASLGRKIIHHQNGHFELLTKNPNHR